MGSRRILIVDDDLNLRRTMSDILETEGYEPVAAATGREALEEVSRTTPAVALIDLRVGDTSGIEVLRGIRQLSPETECIVLTGHATQTSAIEAVNLGAYGYLLKPYAVDQLLVIVQRAIERREARRALEESEERYRRFFQTSRDCTFITSLDGQWLDMNDAAVQLFGYGSKEELRQVNVREFYVNPADRQMLLQEIKEQGAIENRAIDLRRRNGDMIHTLISAVGLHDDLGHLTGFQGTIRDVTERKLAEEALTNYATELAEKNAELERLNEQKNQFLGIAAHELRNPLQFILAYSEFLLDETSDPLTEDQTQFLSVIRSSSEFVVRLVNDLLDVAKIEAGRLQLNLQPTDLGAIVRQNVSLNRTLAAKRGVGLQLHIEPLPVMAIDPDKIEQVLNNLISNAVKYSPPGTAVNVSLSRHNDHLVLSVQDQGPGIPQDELDKVFQPFETTSVQSPRGEKGTGLGLAITKRIVEGHDGRIWVESEPGRGAAFRLSLPIRGEEPQEQDA